MHFVSVTRIGYHGKSEMSSICAESLGARKARRKKIGAKVFWGGLTKGDCGCIIDLQLAVANCKRRQGGVKNGMELANLARFGVYRCRRSPGHCPYDKKQKTGKARWRLRLFL